MLGEVGESEEERIRVPAKGEISRSYVRASWELTQSASTHP